MKEIRDRDKALRTVAKGAGIVFVCLILGKLFTYFYNIVVARLGPEKYGALSLGFAIIQFMLIFSVLGMSEGTERFVAHNLGKKEPRKIKGAIVGPLKLTITLSIFFSVILFLLTPSLSAFFNSPHLAMVLKFLSFSFPFLATGGLPLSVFPFYY